MKATDIVVLDVRKLCDFADYMVICTGDSRRQLRAIQIQVCDGLAGLATGRPHIEGAEGTSWVLVDFYDVVIHIFAPEAREFYDLELLWGDAPKVLWKKQSVKR